MSIVEELTKNMNLWRPQREGLEALDAVIQTVKIGRSIPKASTIKDLAELSIIQKQMAADRFDFNAELRGNGTEFPSFCFAIATGGGKTRLMGACIAYLYETKGFKNFFILSKGETIYNKHRQDDFNTASPKYVFKGLENFPTPRIIDGNNYERYGYPDLFSGEITIYIFNIEKIFNQRTDTIFRFHRFRETLGQSFAEILREMNDLVFLMDESHHFRAEKSLKAINHLQPILGLEFTATPTAKNIIYHYPLSEAVRDGIVKRPVVLARKDDDPLPNENEEIKLRDGIRRHERKKSLLETYCRNNDLQIVIPRVLVSTQDIDHCERVAAYLESNEFFDGAYRGKVLSVHSGSEDEQVQKLLELEKTDNPFEIVVHVNKLKEGWDVKTIYTIIPLRASASDILVEQTIGRGLRLPFGKWISRDPDLSDEERKNLVEIDTLEIMSHENYSKVLEARKRVGEDWPIQVKEREETKEIMSVEIEPDGEEQYSLPIPKIKAKFYTEGEIDLEDVAVRYDRLEDLDPTLVALDLATQEEQDYGKVLEECHGDLVNFFVRILLEETDEFSIEDKKRLQEFVRRYFEKARVPDGSDKEDVLFRNRGRVARDMFDQITKKIEENTRIEYIPTNETITFRSWWHNMLADHEEKDRGSVLEDEIRGNIIGGYQKSIFTRYVFDAKQEKWFADILDRDQEVARWIRPPVKQLSIAWKRGNYSPDFVVEDKEGRFFVVEIKQKREINNPDVLDKARASIGWCKAINQATGKIWEYKLIPHDVIEPNSSFRGVISYALSL